MRVYTYVRIRAACYYNHYITDDTRMSRKFCPEQLKNAIFVRKNGKTAKTDEKKRKKKKNEKN